MGTTIWVLRRSHRSNGDDYDHSAIYNLAAVLDAVADAITVRRLSDFFDWSDFEFNSSENPLPEDWVVDNERWHEPDDAIPSVQAILDHVKHQRANGMEPQVRTALIEELEDCLDKLKTAKAEGDTFQFCVVM